MIDLLDDEGCPTTMRPRASPGLAESKPRLAARPTRAMMSITERRGPESVSLAGMLKERAS
jgi:hypothetical protein